MPFDRKGIDRGELCDRVLGETGTRTVPAHTVQAFTGNNIMPRGDLASRSLAIRLTVDRPDPENRPFIHSDPLAWTEANRGEFFEHFIRFYWGTRVYGTTKRGPGRRNSKPGGISLARPLSTRLIWTSSGAILTNGRVRRAKLASTDFSCPANSMKSIATA